MARIDLPQRGLHLEYESHGAADKPAVILIMGLGLQLVSWPPSLIEALVDAGLRVIVFDNRDVGLSGSAGATTYTSPPRAMLAHLMRRRFVPPYRLRDMADDTLALVDALGIERFHLVGISLGGMVAQTLASEFPERVLSLVSIMSSAGPYTSPWPSPALMFKLVRRPRRGASFEAKLEHFFELMQAIGHVTDPVEIAALRERMSLSIQRAYRPEGTLRQLLAVLADPDRSAAVARIRCPTLIVHGTEDPLVPVQSAYHLAKLLPKAKLELIADLGHYLPRSVVPRMAELIVEHISP